MTTMAGYDPNNPRHALALERLRDDTMMWLASIRPDGPPHLVAVWFVWDGEHIFIFSKDDQKVRNLKHDPRVMVSVDDSKDGGNVITIEGNAELIDQLEASPTLPAYATKYARKLEEFGWTPQSMAAEYNQSIRITPVKMRAW